jgi:exosortase
MIPSLEGPTSAVHLLIGPPALEGSSKLATDHHGKDAMSTVAPTPGRRILTPFASLLVVSVACFVWVFWPTLLKLVNEWNVNPQYSHGFLVPLFAGLLLWLRRGKLDLAAVRPSWWGVPLLAAGLGLRLFGAYYYYVAYEFVSLLPCIIGLWLILGGRAAWRWAWPALLFLAFMIPLPYRVAIALAGPLQRFATVTSTFVMQVLGLPALAEGNVILLNDQQIGIVEACSGLNMLVVFFAMATAVAMVVRRPLVDKLFLVASAIPIALLSNVIRITATGILHEMVDSAAANAFFHDFAGWMMPLMALGLLALELKILSHLFINVPPPAPRGVRLPVPNRGSRGARRRSGGKQPAPEAIAPNEAGKPAGSVGSTRTR